MALGSLISLLQLTKVTNFEIDGFIYVGNEKNKNKGTPKRKNGYQWGNFHYYIIYHNGISINFQFVRIRVLCLPKFGNG